MKANGRGIANVRAKYEDRRETSMFKNQQGTYCKCSGVGKAGSGGHKVSESGGQGLKL